ncbi:CBU_0592 family membrane protein [Solilutibacter silvestris]|uniref:CBU-0592-like domain-containing protein n=1 Tax=Solilutibacter silvestris TaxID=1645665 RepID=A0A2K1Q3H4_9GAMM|nr:hypothetical protein [Lysobacter silvestris]PNS09589.1 hypothetical protein Lysil_1218 [Lysobacter silvestris]
MNDSSALFTLHWWDVAGLAGSLLIVIGFFLLQVGRLRGDGPIYQLLNLIGALAILVSLIGGFNISVFLLESVWALIALYGLARSLRGQRQR